MKRIFKFLSSVLIPALLLLSLPTAAFAGPLSSNRLFCRCSMTPAETDCSPNDNYYGIAANDSTGLDGCFFMTTIEATNANWTDGNNNFILHTTWLYTDNNDSWIEVGFIDGEWADNGTYYKGFYAAQYVCDSDGTIIDRHLKKISGPSTDTGTVHTFQIQRDGTNTWGVYVDYKCGAAWTSGAGSIASIPKVGLETNSLRTTSARWNERRFQIYKNGVWTDWSDGNRYYSGPDYNISVLWASEPTSVFTCKLIPDNTEDN